MSPCPHRVRVRAWQGGLGTRVLFASAPILGGSSVSGWLGTSLGASDTPVLPCPGGAIPRLSHRQAQRPSPACSPLPCCHCHGGAGPARAELGTCPRGLPITSACCDPTNPSRHPVSHARALGACWGGDTHGSRSSLCRLGRPRASNGPSHPTASAPIPPSELVGAGAQLRWAAALGSVPGLRVTSTLKEGACLCPSSLLILDLSVLLLPFAQPSFRMDLAWLLMGCCHRHSGAGAEVRDGEAKV